MSNTTYLLSSAREGDRSALEELYAAHRGRLLAFLRVAMSPSLSRRVAPEDILQETLLESTRKLASFEARGHSSFYAWLVQIARFKISEAERALQANKRAREEPLVLDLVHSGTSPSMGAMRSERAADLREVIAQLPEAQAEAIRLRYLEGLPLPEVAARLGKTEPAVKALVTRAFAALAERIDPSS